MNRYLVRRGTNDVFVWTELLSKRGDLEEVFAKTPAEAATKPAVLDPRRVSIEQLEALGKADLIVFARAKLGIELAGDMPKPEMLDKVKEALLLLPAPGSMPIAETVGPFATAQQAAKKPGDKPDIPPASGRRPGDRTAVPQG